MPADITRLELRLRRRSAIGYAAGMALYTLVVVALYPSFKNSTSLDSLSGSTAAALFGVTGQLTSPGGWLNGNIYGNFFPLIMLLLTIGYGAACLAGQNEDGTLALIAALPVRRRAIVLQKAWRDGPAGPPAGRRGDRLRLHRARLPAHRRPRQRGRQRGRPHAHGTGLRTGHHGRRRGHRPARNSPRHRHRPGRRLLPPQLSRPPRSPGSGPDGTCRSSTGRPATTRSARESASPTSRS